MALKIITLGMEDPTWESHLIRWEDNVFQGGKEVNPTIVDTDKLQGNDLLICASLQNSEDVMKLYMIVGALKPYRKKMGKILLYMPYVPYARQDRICNEGEALAIKEFGELINFMNFDQVFVFDPHSDVTGAILNDVTIINNHAFVAEALTLLNAEFVRLRGEKEKIKQEKHEVVKKQKYQEAADLRDKERAVDESMEEVRKTLGKNVVVVSVDAGALKKIFAVTKSLHALGIEVEFMQADKLRNLKTGEIIKVVLHDEGMDLDGKTIVLIDDICDGGRSFTYLGSAIRESHSPAKVVLIVSHGLFTYGLEPLVGTIDVVISTNSWKQPEPVEGIEYHCINVNFLI